MSHSVSISPTDISRLLNWTGSDPSGERKIVLEDTKLDSDFENAGRWLIGGDVFHTWYSAEPKEVQAFWVHGPGKWCHLCDRFYLGLHARQLAVGRLV